MAAFFQVSQSLPQSSAPRRPKNIYPEVLPSVPIFFSALLPCVHPLSLDLLKHRYLVGAVPPGLPICSQQKGVQLLLQDKQLELTSLPSSDLWHALLLPYGAAPVTPKSP